MKINKKFGFFGEEDDKEIVMDVFLQNVDYLLFPEQLSFASKRLRDDKDVVLAAVLQCARNFYDASKRLRDDKEVVLAALASAECWETLERILKEASPRLQKDKDVLSSFDFYKKNTCSDSQKLEDDKEVVMEAILKNAYQLRNASERLQDDKDVVLAAVSQYGSSIKFASERLQKDNDILLAAAFQDESSLRYVELSPGKKDKILKKARKQNEKFLKELEKKVVNEKLEKINQLPQSIPLDKEDEWYDELFINMIKSDDTLILKAIDKCEYIIKRLETLLFDNDPKISKQYNEVLKTKQVLSDINSSTKDIIIQLDKLRNIENILNETIKESSKFKPTKQEQSIPLNNDDVWYDELLANMLNTDNQFLINAKQRCNNLIVELQKIMFDYDDRIVNLYNELIKIKESFEKSGISSKEIIMNLDKLTDIENQFVEFIKSSQRAV